MEYEKAYNEQREIVEEQYLRIKKLKSDLLAMHEENESLKSAVEVHDKFAAEKLSEAFYLKADLKEALEENKKLKWNAATWGEEFKTLLNKQKEALDVIRFYADVDNWERDTWMIHNEIDVSDCADYPHVTRDVRKTGGKRARDFLVKHEGKGKDGL